MGFVSVVLALIAFAPDGGFTAKLERAHPPGIIAAVQRKLLDPQALVVRDGGETVMRVWFRAAIPVKATEQQLRTRPSYRQIPDGALVGAVEFPKVFTDYRKQRLPAGIYTLRFALVKEGVAWFAPGPVHAVSLVASFQERFGQAPP